MGAPPPSQTVGVLVHQFTPTGLVRDSRALFRAFAFAGRMAIRMLVSVYVITLNLTNTHSSLLLRLVQRAEAAFALPEEHRNQDRNHPCEVRCQIWKVALCLTPHHSERLWNAFCLWPSKTSRQGRVLDEGVMQQRNVNFFSGE